MDKKEIVVYQNEDGSLKLDINLEDETLWLTRKQIATLFNVEKQNVDYHIANIYETNELEPLATTKEILVVQKEGSRNVKRVIDHYNLDMIISIGYRVNSSVATKFRQWATKILKEYMIKGFAMDDERLEKSPRIRKKGYFQELKERVDRIRTSESLMYEQVRDLFKETSWDYSSNAPEVKEFYSSIQNKFHYAVSGMTAAELVFDRISADKEKAGLIHFKGQEPTTDEAKVAKNYLFEKELKLLTLISKMFLDFADIQIARERKISMSDWVKKLDELLKINDFEILQGKGKVSRKQMEEKVKSEMEKYRLRIAFNNAKQIGTK